TVIVLKGEGQGFAWPTRAISPKQTRLNVHYVDRASAGPSPAIRKYEALPSSSLWRCRPPDSRRRVSNDIRNWTAHCLTLNVAAMHSPMLVGPHLDSLRRSQSAQ